jgi:hypothetical protein
MLIARELGLDGSAALFRGNPIARINYVQAFVIIAS